MKAARILLTVILYAVCLVQAAQEPQELFIPDRKEVSLGHSTYLYYAGDDAYTAPAVMVLNKSEGEVNIQNSHISINGKRLELHAGTRIDRNFLFQNR